MNHEESGIEKFIHHLKQDHGLKLNMDYSYMYRADGQMYLVTTVVYLDEILEHVIVFDLPVKTVRVIGEGDGEEKNNKAVITWDRDKVREIEDSEK